jgi:hypothetical protein
MATSDSPGTKPYRWDRLSNSERRIRLRERIRVMKDRIALSGTNARSHLLVKLDDAAAATNAGLYEIALTHLTEAEEAERGGDKA